MLLAAFGPEVVVMSGFMDTKPGSGGPTRREQAPLDVAPLVLGLMAP